MKKTYPISALNLLGPTLQVIGIQQQDQLLRVFVTSTLNQVTCPVCSVPTNKIQSRYQRTLADLNWAAYSVQLLVDARRFYCLNPDCLRHIFCERLDELSGPYARCTDRLKAYLLKLALALGGRPALRFAQGQGLVTSRRTLLRLAVAQSLPTYPTPQILGVDDFALRKGRTYATVLVDMETHQPIEVLADRTTATFAKWLENRPGIKVISRDRASSYALAAGQTCPQALQVADRFHLLKNLIDHLDQFCRRKKVWHYNKPLHKAKEGALIGTTAELSPLALSALSDGGETSSVGVNINLETESKSGRDQTQKQSRYEGRLARYQSVVELAESGWSDRQIAGELGLNRTTVGRYVSAGGPHIALSRPRTPRPGLLDPYKAYVYERWRQDQPTVSELHQELTAQGYRGSIGPIRSFLARLRPSPYWSASRTKIRGKLDPMTIPVASNHTKLSSRAAAWLIFNPPHSLQNPPQGEKEVASRQEKSRQLEALLAWDRELQSAYDLVQEFRAIVRERTGESNLWDWLQRTRASGIKELVSFVGGIERDYEAVKAGLSLEYSNGQLEGQVNRVKTIKKQMYGRATFELLRKRVLVAA